MKNKLLIYTLVAASVLSFGSVDAYAAPFNIGNAGIATALTSYEANTINAEEKIMAIYSVGFPSQSLFDHVF